MKNKPIVTISIPTFNSAVFLPMCFEAINKQTYKDIEVNIIDGGSTDNTIAIAKKYNIQKIFINKGSLMSARYEGVTKAKGEYILLLDCDQILEKNTIEQCVAYVHTHDTDMLILEEDVFSKETIIEKLFHHDRKLVHSVKDINPHTSVLLPRFYKANILKKAYDNVPKEVISCATPQDHAILYLESWKLTQKIGLIPEAVKHIEPSTFSSIWKKFYRWGYYSSETAKTPYDDYFRKRTERFRSGIFRRTMIKASIASIILLLMKGIPYKIGQLVSKKRRKKR